MNLRLFCLIVLASLTLTACSYRYSDDNFRKVQRGMTPAQVKEILGAPTSTPFDGTVGISTSVWFYKDKQTEIKVVFLNDKVIATTRESK